jgi:small conductance mechanosensitive channel
MDLDITLFYRVAFFVVIMVVTALVAKFAKLLIRRLFRAGMPLVATHAQQVVVIIVWIIGALFALELLGIRLDLLLLLIALVGIAAVIAAKDTLQNIASKYFSDVYVPYKVGDLIKVKNFSGRVIEINPISTILLTENEELISIPNALFLREIMVNISPHAWKEIMIPMVISKEVDPPEFESEVLESCNKLKMYFDERFLPIIAIKKRTGKSVELTLTLLVKEPSKKDAILSEINERVNEIIERMKKRE